MKKIIALAALAAITTQLLAADGAAVKKPIPSNGGFEEISKIVKSTSEYFRQHIKSGWQLGFGPIATFPAKWLPNGGAAKVDIIQASVASNNVHSGEYAIKVTPLKACHMYTDGAKAGKYTVSVFVKGTSQVCILGYFYGPNKDTGKPEGKPTRIFVEGKATEDEWTEIKHVVDTRALSPEGTSFAVALSVVGDYAFIDDVTVTAVEE